MIAVDCPQQDKEWYMLKMGLPSASCFDRILTPGGEPSKQRQKYLYMLAGEKVSGIKEPCYQSFAMLQGIEREEEARRLYELVKGTKVQRVGICYPDDRKLYGCSPDGLVGQNGLVEIKCPEVHTHVDYLLRDEMPGDYFPQAQGQLLVTGRKWVDFVSYYPGLKPLILRVTRSERYIATLKSELEKFARDLKKTVKQLRTK